MGCQLNLAVRFAFQIAGQLKYIHALAAFLERLRDFRLGR